MYNGEIRCIGNDHRSYGISDTNWKLVEYRLYNYLNGLSVLESSLVDVLDVYRGIECFYYRERVIVRGIDDDSDGVWSGVINSDPWNRRFRAYPYGGVNNNSFRYSYRRYRGDGVIEVTILVTTVNGEPVYCVDNIELIDN